MGQASWMPLPLTKIVVLNLGYIWCSTALGVILLHPGSLQNVTQLLGARSLATSGACINCSERLSSEQLQAAHAHAERLSCLHM